ncbi:MAG: hypothetical protein CMJ64_14325 [Planctomycetaceae bacterium]|nr:hypothetical protein [Planctomycetaceae bacterium]
MHTNAATARPKASHEQAAPDLPHVIALARSFCCSLGGPAGCVPAGHQASFGEALCHLPWPKVQKAGLRVDTAAAIKLGGAGGWATCGPFILAPFCVRFKL